MFRARTEQRTTCDESDDDRLQLASIDGMENKKKRAKTNKTENHESLDALLCFVNVNSDESYVDIFITMLTFRLFFPLFTHSTDGHKKCSIITDFMV